MKNIIEVAAWVIVVKAVAPYVFALGFIVVAVVTTFLDDVTNDTYTGTKLRIRNKRK